MWSRILYGVVHGAFILDEGPSLRGVHKDLVMLPGGGGGNSLWIVHVEDRVCMVLIKGSFCMWFVRINLRCLWGTSVWCLWGPHSLGGTLYGTREELYGVRRPDKVNHRTSVTVKWGSYIRHLFQTISSTLLYRCNIHNYKIGSWSPIKSVMCRCVLQQL